MKTQTKAQKDLKRLRKEIDAVDKLFMKSLARRFKIVNEVGKLKAKNGFPIHQLSRMEEMLNARKVDAERLNLDGKLIYNIFDLLHEASLNCQEKIAFEFNRKNNKKAKNK